jgi:GGDEF domain-containing protein
MSSLPCSLGVAVGPRDGRTPREVMRAADASMYDAKRLRRSTPNRVTVSMPDSTIDLASA